MDVLAQARMTVAERTIAAQHLTIRQLQAQNDLARKRLALQHLFDGPQGMMLLCTGAALAVELLVAVYKGRREKVKDAT